MTLKEIERLGKLKRRGERTTKVPPAWYSPRRTWCCLDTASYRTPDALATFMKRHPGLKIEVGGYTNLRTTDRFANDLSANRAQAVMRYLTDNGVAADRVTCKGYGKTRPRVEAVSKEADRVNQRVEVKVLEK